MRGSWHGERAGSRAVHELAGLSTVSAKQIYSDLNRARTTGNGGGGGRSLETLFLNTVWYYLNTMPLLSSNEI